MKAKIKTIGLLFLALTLGGCNELPLQGFFIPTSKTVEDRFDDSMNWNEKHPDYFTLNVPTDDYRVYVCGDVHVDKTTHNIIRFLSDGRDDPEAYFSICLGDLVKDSAGMQILYDAIHAAVEPYEPMYMVAGNHDLYFNLWEKFNKFFGSSTYSVTVQTPSYKDLYIFLDNAGSTLGIKQMKWLENVLSQQRADCRHCIISAHVNIFRDNRPQSEIANLHLNETYALGKLLSDYDVELVFQGHEHFRAYTEYLGVGYQTLDAIADWFKKASYVIMSVGSDLAIEWRVL